MLSIADGVVFGITCTAYRDAGQIACELRAEVAIVVGNEETKWSMFIHLANDWL